MMNTNRMHDNSQLAELRDKKPISIIEKGVIMHGDNIDVEEKGLF